MDSALTASRNEGVSFQPSASLSSRHSSFTLGTAWNAAIAHPFVVTGNSSLTSKIWRWSAASGTGRKLQIHFGSPRKIRCGCDWARAISDRLVLDTD
jgi:hypothetical protein